MVSQPQKSPLAKFAKTRGKRLVRVLALAAIFAVFLVGFWFILRVALGTECPLVPVCSGNMCVAESPCDGFNHPFDRTLHNGDLVMVQGVDARNVSDAYPNSDILVFHSPKQDPSQEDRLIITRVVAKEEKNGIIYFKTKSDGEGSNKWPETPDVTDYEWWSDYRGENCTLNGMISEKLLVGKVVLRIPWFGHIVLFVQNWFWIFVILVIVAVMVIAEFVLPKARRNKKETEPNQSLENTAET